MQEIIPLAVNATQVLKLCNMSRSCLQTLVKRGLLTPLLHIKKNYRLFAMSEILELMKPKSKK